MMDYLMKNFILKETNRTVRIFITVAVLNLIFYKFLNQYLLNVPRYLLYSSVPFIAWYSIVFIRNKSTKFSIEYVLVYGKGLFVLAIFYYFFIYSSFCIASKLVSLDNNNETYYCELTRATSSTRNKAVYYKFLGKTYRFAAYGKEFFRMSKEGVKDGEQLKIKVRKGLLDSYFISEARYITN